MTDKAHSLRLLDDNAAVGSWNMAVDQAILEHLEITHQPTLRFYQWSPATLSLGYFQNWDDRSQHVASQNCDCIRRTSGGGAIMHDQELTYSLALPTQNRWSSKNTEVYNLVHESLTDVFRRWSINLEICEVEKRAPVQKNQFLCFQRRANGDLLLGSHKVVGSAQRRTKNALLQHGSILLRRSSFAPELAGIEDLTNSGIELNTLKSSFANLICNRLGLISFDGDLSESEGSSANVLETERFRSRRWNLKLR